MNEESTLSVLLLLIILWLLFNISNIGKIESMSDTSRASDCQQSMKDYLVALEAQKKEDEDNYNKAVNEWKAKKNAFQKTFSGDPTLWKKYCSDGSCDMNNFFTQYPQSVIHGFDLQGSIRTDTSGCLQSCLNRDDCIWCQYRNGECWIKGTLNDNNFTSYLKTNTGWKRVDNLRTDGMDQKNYNKSYNPDNIPGDVGGDFNIILSRKDGSGSWFKNIHKSPWDGDTYFKNSASSYTFSDSSPVIIKNVGPYPTKEKTQIPLSLVCQDCRSIIEKTQVSDSKDVAVSQFNQCIANLEESNNTNTPTDQQTNTPSKTPTDQPTNTPNTSTNTQTNTPNTPNTQVTTDTNPPYNNRYLIAIGVLLFSFLLTNIIVIIIMTRRTE